MKVAELKQKARADEGMTVKESDTVTESSVEARGNAITESTTTVRNKVQISAFGADGQFYNLA